MRPTDLLFPPVLLLYLVGAALNILGASLRHPKWRKIGNACAVGGFGLHTLDLALVLGPAPAEALMRGEFYMSLLAWSLLCIFFFLWWRLKLEFLGLLAAPLACILFVSSQAVTGARLPLPKELGALFFGLHIGSLFMAISFLAMACGAGAAYIFLERKIKTKEKLSALAKALPSLSTWDRVNQWAVLAGFPLYTLGLVSGFLWAKLTWDKIFSADPKEVAGVFIWLLFAFLFHQRLFVGRRGRRTAWLAIWVFGLSLASMIFVNFFMTTHHSFAT